MWQQDLWKGFLTNLGTIFQLEDALHSVDGDDDGLWAKLGPGYMDAQLVDMTAHECKGQFQLL